MLKVAIIGASGYTGCELMRLSVQHPQIELVSVSSEKFAGRAVGEVFPFPGGYGKAFVSSPLRTGSGGSS